MNEFKFYGFLMKQNFCKSLELESTSSFPLFLKQKNEKEAETWTQEFKFHHVLIKTKNNK